MADGRGTAKWWQAAYQPEYDRYKQQGGGLSYNAWIRQDRPTPPTQVSAYAQSILERAGIPIPPTARVAPVTPGERVSIAQREARGALGQVGVAPTGRRLGVEIPRRPTEPPPSGFRWGWDNELNRWIPKFIGLTPQQQSQQELAEQELELRRQQAQPQPISPFQQQQLELQRQRLEFERQPVPVSPYQQQQFGLQQQQFEAQQQQYTQQQAQFQQQLEFQQEQARLAAAEQERQYRSQLAANPINWLQYSAYTGEQPVVQPWMIPLGFQDTGGAVTPQGLQAGQPIPGFQAQAGQQAPQTFTGLPALTTPSAQLQARWGPTATAQFLGYRQARTGASPAETQFRLTSGRAPTGRFGGFSRFR